MPWDQPTQFVYVDVRVLFVLMLFATGAMQYVLIGAVKLAVHFTRERRKRVEPVGSSIILLSEHRKEVADEASTSRR